MVDFLFKTLWGKIIVTLFISMVPVIELRGAIPWATGMGLSPWIAIPVAIIGNLIPIPFIILFIKKIFAWMRKVSPKLNKVVDRMEAKAEKNKEKGSHLQDMYVNSGYLFQSRVPFKERKMPLRILSAGNYQLSTRPLLTTF